MTKIHISNAGRVDGIQNSDVESQGGSSGEKDSRKFNKLAARYSVPYCPDPWGLVGGYQPPQIGLDWL